MVGPGAGCPKRSTPEEVAAYTLRMLKSRVPPSTAGIMFLSGRGLHSSTVQLNLCALYGIGGARRGCVARVKGMLVGV